MKTIRYLSLFGVLHLAGLAMSGAVQAQMYKWTDANGQVHYSDNKPSNSQNDKSLQVLDNAKSPSTTTATLKAREPSKLARPIMIRPPKLPWGDGDTNIVGDQAEHVGLYHFGSACVSPTAMVLPDALIRHPRFFPTAHTIGYEVVRTLDKKNYKALWHPVHKNLNRERFHDGIVIDIRIPKLKYQVCYKSKTRNYRNTSINKLTEDKFTYKKLALTAVWDVSTANGEPLASFTTKVNGRAWIHDSGYASTFARTLDRALAQLFSQTDFQALLYDGYEGPLPEPNNRSAEESVLESIMDRSNSLFLSVQQQVAAYAGFSKQAKLTEVFAITQQVKTRMTEHYMTHDLWPGSLEQLGISSSSYAADSDILDAIYTSIDGTITMELSDSYGEEPLIEFRPNVSVNSMLSWHCASNLSPDLLPASLECEALY